MPISYIFSGEPMNGTAEDDFFIAFQGSTGTSNNTVNGIGGDDLVIGDSSDSWLLRASTLNGSIATFFNLESVTGIWTTAENQMFGDWTIPHSTTIVEATIGQSEFFRVAVGAGQQITVDIDFASNTAIGVPRDLVVELQDLLGNVIVTADDSLLTQGGRGSFPSAPGGTASHDPYLTFAVPTAGNYYINVRPYGAGPGATFTENNTFVLNVSVTGHAVIANNPVQGNDIINGGDGHDALFGQGGGDTINGDAGDDFIDSGSGGDIVHGGEGNDTLYGGDGSEENIHGDNGNDTLISGGEGHYYGDAGNDLIFAGLTSGVNEVLDGGADIDTIDTTTWSGSYTINLVTGVTIFGESFTNFENIVSGNGADTITGTDGANTITTQGGIDTVTAGAGNDVVAGGADGDTLDGGADSDILSYRTSSGAVTINLIANTVIGGHAAGDLISNFEGAWGSVLGDTLTADAGNNELRGFEGNDVLSGGVGNDILDGGLNDDTMTGGIGNDTYFMDSLSDTIVELPGEGTDTLAVDFSYVLANGSVLEWLATTDPTQTKDINLTGNSGVNSITGNAGANVLNGAGGNDALFGLGGNDIYHVDAVGDSVYEAGGRGNDVVYASLSYTLTAGQEVEVLSTSSQVATTAINLVGNAFGQTIYGNAGANILNGAGGNDILIGFGGNDIYQVDAAGDAVYEGAAGGTDVVYASVSFTLTAGAQVETLSTNSQAATAAINLVGNALAQTIYGNAGANVLNGAGGNDILIGLGGNDIYHVDAAGDAVYEAAAGGTDVVYASVSYVLTAGAQVEVLSTNSQAATTAINLTGNALDQTIYGNAGANTLNGVGGNDILIGLGGNDIYHVDAAGDAIYEAAAGGTDVVYAGASYTLTAGQEVETLSTSSQVAVIALNLTGNALGQTIYGNAGTNVLDGKGGNDILIGLAGTDTFAFTTALGAGNVDLISGYSVADDTIQLENAVFTGLAAGALAAGAFATGPAATQADDRIIYNGATGALLFDADGVGGAAAVQFATLATGLAMTASDFLVI